MLGRTTQNDTMINSAQSIKYSCKRTGFTTFGMHGIHRICRPSSTLHRHEKQTYTKIYASRISDQCVLAINHILLLGLQMRWIPCIPNVVNPVLLQLYFMLCALFIIVSFCVVRPNICFF